jgi:hypothetical protein
MNKDLKKIIEALVEQDFTVKTAANGHIIVRKNGMFVTVFAGTGSDWRGLRNGIADCRRFGFRWPPKR